MLVVLSNLGVLPAESRQSVNGHSDIKTTLNFSTTGFATKCLNVNWFLAIENAQVQSKLAESKYNRHREDCKSQGSGNREHINWAAPHVRGAL